MSKVPEYMMDSGSDGDVAISGDKVAVRTSTRRAVKPSQQMIDSNEYERRRRMQFVSRNDVDSGSESDSDSDLGQLKDVCIGFDAKSRYN